MPLTTGAPLRCAALVSGTDARWRPHRPARRAILSCRRAGAVAMPGAWSGPRPADGRSWRSTVSASWPLVSRRPTRPSRAQDRLRPAVTRRSHAAMDCRPIIPSDESVGTSLIGND
jgi:hypothetical protein